MNDDSISKAEEARLLEADRDIDEYKQQLHIIDHTKPTKYKVNNKLMIVIKIISVLIILTLIATSIL